jgi:hypothetical protein
VASKARIFARFESGTVATLGWAVPFFVCAEGRFHADFLDFSIFVLSLHQILPTTAVRLL